MRSTYEYAEPGVARRLIRFAIATVGHLRGGLAMASVLACMLFAAVSGSSPATVVAIGSIVIAGMVKAGYSKDFAAGVIANSGTLGILIPPSIVMVVYAAATDVSVGRMFLAGVIPGLVAGGMLMVAIYIAARIKGLPRQPRATIREFFQSGREAIWGLLLIVIIMGGIYGGIFTPTEAATVKIVTARMSAPSFDERFRQETIIGQWCRQHVGQELPVTCSKDYAMLELWDDRAVQVVPNTGRPVGHSTQGLD